VTNAHVIARPDILNLALRLGARLRRVGASEWAGPCPVCGGRDRFGVNVAKQVWHCRHCDRGGDAIDLVRHLNGCSYGEALAFLGGSVWQKPKRPPAAVKAENTSFVREQIATIMRELVHVRGTPGEQYLNVRRIDTAAIADVLERIGAIGWHPAVYFKQPGHELNGRHLGCIVAIMTDPITADPTGAISRTYINANLQKVCKGKTLGSPPGIIRLSEDADVLYGLGLAEGFETTLDIMARGFRPCWSTGGKALMAAFPVLPAIQSLTLFADNDPDGGGLKAAQGAQARWLAAGRAARVRMTAKPGDINDIGQGTS